MTTQVDVIIVGGGMVGATLACALGNSGLRVALVDNHALEEMRPTCEPDLRVSAINRASQRIFAAVGAWEAMADCRISPFREMRVWDATGSGQIHFDSAALGEPLLGWIIENSVLQTALLKCAQAFDNVAFYCPTALQSVEQHIGHIDVQLQNGTKLRAQLLVGADGAHSKVRELFGITTRGWSYDQQGIVCTVATEKPHQETAWQRFLPTGPLAFLPLYDGRCSIVWSTTVDQADVLLDMGDDDFAVALAQAFAWRLGAITKLSLRGVFPLRLQYAHAYVRSRCALIGDAAHVIHPLAGQGANLGFLDAAALAEILLDAVAAGKDIGLLKVLRRYERWRKGDNILTMGIMDGFKRLFGNVLPPLRIMRNLGLNLADAATPIKHQLARRAMGLNGDLPQLARNPYSW